MRFFDRVERDPEDYVYVLKLQKQMKDYPSLEIVRELIQTDKMCFCKIKVKHLKVNDGFFDVKENYVSYRME